MDDLAQALNDSLSRDFPNAKLTHRLTATEARAQMANHLPPQGKRPGPVEHSEQLAKTAAHMAGEMRALSQELVGTTPGDDDLIDAENPAEGIFPQVARNEVEALRSLEAIGALISHIRGQL
jgi:hypothetical protein